MTYSATVSTTATGVPTPGGSVTFSTGSTTLCVATLSGGTGSCNSAGAPAGTDTISGMYSGNGVFSGSSATTTLVVNSPPPPPTHGYWLVGSDGGIFTFGSAQFYGSTGSLHLQRPVVGIVPTTDRGGYWLDASDGGIFAFGDAGFYGSIPGLGLHPAGSGSPNSLNAPIVGMVPSSDGRGYFMVASDGGVFAFGDARFAGSCPGIGGCNGAAVAVMPDASG
ncbi:MAG TPA: Ig-like domain-containing protein, partial [Acidimicrobiales bacterium]|nr:Ig-like domain-containing protein [Acidimicrobiales bacterium]